MSHDPSRKSFIAKLTGLAAIAGIAPRVLAKMPASTSTPVPSAPAVVLRPDSRAVARRVESV